MALKQAVRERILNDVIRSVKSADWKVLVVDQPSMRIISACCKMTEIMTEGITLVEDLSKRREPLPSLDAVYLIMPTSASVNMLISDFDNAAHKPIYKNAHVFFTEACPEDVFNELSRSQCARFITTLKEINVAFVPYESQVFSMDTPALSMTYYSGCRLPVDGVILDRCAEQLATLCVTLAEYPLIRYLKSERNAEFASLVQQKLDAYKADDNTIGQGAGKDRSQLIVIDRGFDPVSPLVHELTMQAMTYDLLHVDNDVCRYDSNVEGEAVVKETLLDENDDVWRSLRHQHIAVASQQVVERLKEFADNKRVRMGSKPSLRDLSMLMKQAPQYQKELSRYSAHFSIAESCMTIFTKHTSRLCAVEQELVMGTDAAGDKIKDHVKRLAPLLQDKSVSGKDKVRLILLYILQKGGDTEENVVKLCQHANLSPDDRNVILAMRKLGVPVLLEEKQHAEHQSYMSSGRTVRDHAYDLSRWTPYVKDIIEEAIEGKLDEKKFPFHSGTTRAAAVSSSAVSARYGQWHKERAGQSAVKSGPRLIVFIIGGVCYSELRCAYEVASVSKTWDVIIGSSHIITPTEFLDNLSQLSTAG